MISSYPIKNNELDTKRQIRELNRDAYGTYLFDAQKEAIDKQEQAGLKSLQQNYDREVLNAYATMLKGDTAVRQSNVFTGYKDYLIDENRNAFDSAVMNAYSSYLKNAGTYREQMDAARGEVDKSINAQETLLKDFYNELPAFIENLNNTYDELNEADKRKWLGGKYLEQDTRGQYRVQLPKTFAEGLAEDTRYARYVSNGEFADMYQFTDNPDDAYALYNIWYNADFNGYTFSKYLQRYKPDLYERLNAENAIGTGTYRDLFNQDIGDKQMTTEEALKPRVDSIQNEIIKKYGTNRYDKIAGEDKEETVLDYRANGTRIGDSEDTTDKLKRYHDKVLSEYSKVLETNELSTEYIDKLKAELVPLYNDLRKLVSLGIGDFGAKTATYGKEDDKYTPEEKIKEVKQFLNTDKIEYEYDRLKGRYVLTPSSRTIARERYKELYKEIQDKVYNALSNSLK